MEQDCMVSYLNFKGDLNYQKYWEIKYLISAAIDNIYLYNLSAIFSIKLYLFTKDILNMSRKEAQQKDLAAVMAKDIGGKNPIFSADSIAELHSMFSLYADPRQRKADIRDILMTAKTLGLDRYELVYRVVEEIGDAYGGDPLDFETFLRELTQRIGNPFTEEGRRSNFALLDTQGKGELDINDMRYINQQLRYGYDDDQLTELIHGVGGYGADTITGDKYNRFVAKKISARKAL